MWQSQCEAKKVLLSIHGIRDIPDFIPCDLPRGRRTFSINRTDLTISSFFAAFSRRWLPCRRQQASAGGAACSGEGDGGPCRDRTYDQLIKSQLLYQLS